MGKVYMRQQCDLAAKNTSLMGVSRSVACKLMELINSLCSVLVSPLIYECYAWFGSLQYSKDRDVLESSGGTQMWLVESGISDVWVETKEAELVHL